MTKKTILIFIFTCVCLIALAIGFTAMAIRSSVTPGDSTSVSDSSVSDNSVSDSSAVSQASQSSDIGSSDASQSSQSASSGDITEPIAYTSLLAGETGTVKLGSSWEITFPEKLRACLTTPEALQKQVQQYISSTDKPENVTQEDWQKAMSNKGYFAAYPDLGIWISDRFLARIDVKADTSETETLFNSVRSNKTGDIISSIFGDYFSSLLYDTSGIDSMTRLGDTNNDTEDLQSFVFQCKTANTKIAQGYYGYFILAHNKINKEYAIIILAGVDNLLTPDDLQAIYESFTHASSDTGTYWYTFKATAG